MADGKHAVAVDHWLAANVSKRRQGAKRARRRKIVGPYGPAVLDAQRIKLAGRIRHDHRVALHRRARPDQQIGGFRQAIMRPQPMPVGSSKDFEFVIDGNREDTAGKGGRRSVRRACQTLAPDFLAGRGIDGNNLGIAGGDEDAPAVISNAAAEHWCVGILRLRIEAPYPVAAFRVERRNDIVGVGRKYPAVGDDRLRGDTAVPPGPLADIRFPGATDRRRERKMIHRVIGIAAGARPFRIVERRRQRNRRRLEFGIRRQALLQLENGNARSLERSLLGAAASCKRQTYRQRDAGREAEGHGLRAAIICAARCRALGGALGSSASCWKLLRAPALSPAFSWAKPVSSIANGCHGLAPSVRGLSRWIAPAASPLSRATPAASSVAAAR